VETVIFLSWFFDEYKVKKKKDLFRTEIFCNIINIFTVDFDQFNASLLNKSIIYFVLFFILTTPDFWMVVYIWNNTCYYCGFGFRMFHHLQSCINCWNSLFNFIIYLIVMSCRRKEESQSLSRIIQLWRSQNSSPCWTTLFLKSYHMSECDYVSNYLLFRELQR